VQKFDQEGRSNYGIAVAQSTELTTSFRFLNRDYTHKTNDLGWVGFESLDIIIGKKK
jgi:hypothetical protein